MNEPVTNDLTLRFEPRPADRARVREIVAATAFFRAEEIVIAVELVDERLRRGEASDYFFVFADEGDAMLGYSCFGPIPLTVASWDLYWIAVDPGCQGRGLGRRLLAASEDEVRRRGGTRIYLDTSTRVQYVPTRAFYERCGYELAARLEDFYGPGDGKAVYCKVLSC
ncbi:MAG TPA: GNAT family N-acetyltransferase [Thermoanaerobaculia bacterium]|jgi:ribosomal protein S18 acetylase RimI-like enzyme